MSVEPPASAPPTAEGTDLLDRLQALIEHVESVPQADAIAELLWTRQVIAAAQRGGDIDMLAPLDIDRLRVLDDRLRALSGTITSTVAPATVAGWRRSASASPDDWWWHLADLHHTWATILRRAFAAAVWLVAAVALSFLIENVKRLLPTSADVTSTVAHGFLGLIVAGSVVQFARDWFGKTDAQLAVSAALAASLCALALGAHFARPWLAERYSNDGVELKLNRRYAAAIANYEQALLLNPDDATSHYNLGSSYEAVQELDKAEAAYRNAIRLADDPFAYERLARLTMLRRKDWNLGLALLKRSEESIPTYAKARDVDPQDLVKLQMGIRRLRAWAYVEVPAPKLASSELHALLKVLPEDGAAHCLLWRLLNTNDPEKAKAHAEACIAQSFTADSIEPMWLASASEVLE